MCVCVCWGGRCWGSSLSKMNQDVLKGRCFISFSSNACEEIRVNLQKLLSGTNLAKEAGEMNGFVPLDWLIQVSLSPIILEELSLKGNRHKSPFSSQKGQRYLLFSSPSLQRTHKERCNYNVMRADRKAWKFWTVRSVQNTFQFSAVNLTLKWVFSLKP